MPFLTRSVNEILEDTFEQLQDNTNITRLTPGGKARTILDIVGQLINEVYEEFDNNLARAFITTANGRFLDLFGAILGEPREPSVAAEVDSGLQAVKFYVASGTFGDINGNSDIFLPRNTIISTRASSKGATFRLVEDTTLPASGNTIWVSAEATGTGEAYNIGSNELQYHDFTGYTDYLNETLLVNNIFPIANGKNLESDANYRYRLTQKITEAEAANETAIRLAALSVPGVSDVIVKNYYRGIGTFGLIVKSLTPTASDSLIDAVTTRVNKVKGMGTIGYVRAQKEIGFSMTTRVWYKQKLSDDEMEDIENTMIDTVIDYVNNLDLGETLYTNRLMASLLNISDNILDFGGTEYLIDEGWIYVPTDLGDNRISQRLILNYTPRTDEERIIIEPTITTPVSFLRRYGSKT